MPPYNETYLGDGLYASFDGYQICLRAPRIDGDDVVYFEFYTLKNFTNFTQTLPEPFHVIHR